MRQELSSNKTCIFGHCVMKQSNVIFSLIFFLSTAHFLLGQLPKGFCPIDKQNSTIVFAIKYSTTDNFVGRTIEGYTSPKIVLTTPAATALQNVQNALLAKGLGLKLFDAYRPQRSVDDFMRWINDAQDTLTKANYYPNLSKKELLEQGYIAKKSGHSRGSTVDVTLIYTTGANKGMELDMGGRYDFFGELSNYNYKHLTQKQKNNRQCLRELMIQNGFVPYDKEWWHFTLKNEPFPTTYFNF